MELMAFEGAWYSVPGRKNRTARYNALWGVDGQLDCFSVSNYFVV